jgi:hypothetical protein
LNYKYCILLIFKFSKKINFSSELHFFFFLSPWFDIGERELSNSGRKGRKPMLTIISPTKMVDIGINGFYLATKVPLGCFFTLKNKFKLWKIFLFQVDLGFLCGFFRLFKLIDEFIKCLESFLSVLD